MTGSGERADREQTGDARRMWRLLDIARTLFAETEPEAVYRRILEAALELTGARYAGLGVLNAERSGLASLHTAGIDEQTRHEIGALPRGRGVLGLLVSDAKPLRIADVGRHPASYGFPPGHPVMRSFLGVPIHVHGEVRGNLYLADKPGEFDDSDEEVAIIFADWAATAIDLAGTERKHARRWRDAAVATAGATDEGAPAPATVLLVEEEPALRDRVLMMLEDDGYHVLAASDGLEAIELAARHDGELDLLIADVVMPGLSGPQIAARLRELRPGLEVLFMSGYNDGRLVTRGVEQTRVNLLAKPFTPEQLHARVRALTANRPS